MTTATYDVTDVPPRRIAQSAAAAANGARMSEVLAEQAKSRSVFDRIRSAPRALGAWLRATMRTFRLDAVVDGVQSAWSWAWSRLSGILGTLGIGNIIGTAMTAGQLRDATRSTLATGYSIVRKPISWLLSGVGWLMRKLGLGKAVDWTTEQIHSGESFVTAKYDAAMTWLDEREHSGAMRWARSFFQAEMVRRVIGIFRPGLAGPWVYIAALFVPTFGARQRAVAAEDAAISRAADVLRAAGDTAAQMAEAKTTGSAEIPGELALHKPTGKLHQVIRFEDPTGEKFVKIDGVLYEPGHIDPAFELGQVVGKLDDQGKDAAAAAAASASANGTAPRPVGVPREAARAAGKGTRRS